MKNTITFLLIFIPVIAFGQFKYLNQTKKYIIDKHSDCNISEYTDTSVCTKCNSSSENCFYFNDDGVCYMVACELNEEDTNGLVSDLSSDGYTKIADKEIKYKYIKPLCKSTRCVEIYKHKEDFYVCVFYKLNTSTLKCDD